MDYDVGELVEVTFSYFGDKAGVRLERGMTLLLVDGPFETSREIKWTVLSPYGIVTDVPQHCFDYDIPPHTQDR